MVSATTKAAVLWRQGGICLAPLLQPDVSTCRTATGAVPMPHQLQMDHVRSITPIGTLAKTQDGGFGKRPPDDVAHLAAVCFYHHMDQLQGGSGWAPAHRPAMRAYLATWSAGGTVEEAVAAGRAAMAD